MLRFLRSIVSKRSTSGRHALVPPADDHREEERLAISAYATFERDEFEKRTGYHVRDEQYFLQAVIHRSYLQLCPPGVQY